MKKILVLIVICLSVFIIYLTTIDKRIYYLALGDNNVYPSVVKNSFKDKLEVFVENYTDRTIDLINEIEDNKSIMVNGKEKTLKNALIKADVITISLNNDLLYKLKIDNENIYEYIDELFVDIENLFILLKEYCKEDIFITNYNINYDKKIIDYANSRLKILCEEYGINYVDIKGDVNTSIINAINKKVFEL